MGIKVSDITNQAWLSRIAAVRKQRDVQASPQREPQAKPDRYGTFAQWCVDNGIPMPVREHRFHATRKWRFDFAWPDKLVALEVEGGVWSQGRHTRGSGFIADMEKYNTAASLWWLVLRRMPIQLETDDTSTLLRGALARDK